MMLAPIALFVYNRPAHTRQTVEALQHNDLAKESDLIIYSDAPKTPDATASVREVRLYIRQIVGFRSVTILERETNFGLARSIIDGVTTIVHSHGRIIVLEDDLVTSPYFLDFMNKALNAYQDDEKVMHISGYMFPIDNTDMSETFFLRTASCWGWATWERAWKHFEKKPNKLVSEFTETAIRRFNLDGAYNFWEQVKLNESGLLNSWAVFWYATIFQRNGLCLHPKFSMTLNIGHDDSGQHCSFTNRFDVHLANKPNEYFDANVIEDNAVIERLIAYFSPARPSFISSVLRSLRSSQSRNIANLKNKY